MNCVLSSPRCELQKGYHSGGKWDVESTITYVQKYTNYELLFLWS